MSESDVVVVERKGVKIKNPVVINAFPGPGFVGSMAASHLIMGLGMREVGHVEKEIPIICIVVINSPRIKKAKMAAKSGVESSRPDTFAAFIRFNPS